MRPFALAFIAAALFWAPAARAEVASSSPTSFVIHAETEIAATPAEVWRNVRRVDRQAPGACRSSSSSSRRR